MNVKIKVMNEKNKSLKCAKWLSKCVSFGWEKESIPALEKLWNDNHDEKGNLIKSAIPKQKVDGTELYKEVVDKILDWNDNIPE